MGIQRRLERLEAATAKPKKTPVAVVRTIMQPSASGPELVALMLRPLHGGKVVQLDRNPREDENAFRARFDAACAS